VTINRKTIALALVGLGVLLLLVWSLRVGTAGFRLWRALSSLQRWGKAPEQAAMTQLCPLVQGMDADLQLLHREAGFLIDAAPWLGWVPHWGGTFQATPNLFDVACALTQAGRVGCAAVAPLLEDNSFSLPRFLSALQAQHGELLEAAAALAQAQLTWAQVDRASLASSVARKIAVLDQALPLARTAFTLMSAAPDLLGLDGPRTYLILALNESELRPGGGFISAVGEIEFAQGQLQRMSFADSYAVDDFRQPYPEAPAALRRYMGIDLLVYRDSNWWPDFPSAVQAAWSLYRPRERATTYAGVIAVDQRALELALSAVGEVVLSDSDVPISAQNVREYIRRSWEPPAGDPTAPGWWSERKSVMGPLASALWQRLQAGQVDKVKLAYGLLVMLREKHVQLALEHPQAAAALRAQGWDGAVPHEFSGDFVFLVDANVGYNKVNERVRQAITYTVDLRPAAPIAELRAVYTNTVTRAVPCTPSLRYPSTYQQMIERCYWDYVRVYAHPQATLLEALALPIPASALLNGQAEDGTVQLVADPLGHWRVFGGLMVLPTGSTQERWWRWALPAELVTWRSSIGTYRLRVQKQAGAAPYPATVRVLLPPGVTVTYAAPAPSAQTAEGVVWQFSLDRDRDFVLELRRP